MEHVSLYYMYVLIKMFLERDCEVPPSTVADMEVFYYFAVFVQCSVCLIRKYIYLLFAVE